MNNDKARVEACFLGYREVTLHFNGDLVHKSARTEITTNFKWSNWTKFHKSIEEQNIKYIASFGKGYSDDSLEILKTDLKSILFYSSYSYPYFC